MESVYSWLRLRTTIVFAILGVAGCHKPPPEPVLIAPTSAPLYREVAIDASSTVKNAAELSGLQTTWSLERPPRSQAALEGQELLVRTMRPDVPGRYAVTLTLTRDEQKTAKTQGLMVDNLLSLPVYLGQPWNEVRDATASLKCVAKDVDPLVWASKCTPAAPDAKRRWTSFLMRSVSRGGLASIRVENTDHDCVHLIPALGTELEGVGFKKVRAEEGTVGVQAWFQNDAGFDASLACCPQGACDTFIELGIHGVGASPTGLCPSLREAPSGVRVLANMSIVELMRFAAGNDDPVDPGIECNHAQWKVGPVGLGRSCPA